MKIAVTYENGNVFQHFGHTKQFKLYEVENDSIVSSFVLDTNGSGHGALAVLLSENNVNVLICGGIGGGAQKALADVGIKLYGGVQGNVDNAVDAFLSGKLEYNPNVRCNHHDNEKGNSSHSCGNHSCGN